MAEKEQEFRHHYNMSLAARVQYMTAAVASLWGRKTIWQK